MFMIGSFLGCFDSLMTVGDQASSAELPIQTNSTDPLSKIEEKTRVAFSIPKIREYQIQHIYPTLPPVVYAANNGINLRNRATANSSVLTKIPLGHKIDVLAQDQKVTLGTRTDHWYHVRVTINNQTHEGFLFGSTMTPYRIAADWDDDGKKEAMFAMFNERKELLLRIQDPNGENTWSNMGAYADGEFLADQVVVKALPKSIAGLPLLKIEVANPEQTMFWTKYASYHHEKLLRALEYTEIESDTTYSKKEPKFGPKKLSLLSIEGMVQADGSEKQTIVTKRYRYRMGVFHEKNVSEPVEKVLPPSVTN